MCKSQRSRGYSRHSQPCQTKARPKKEGSSILKLDPKLRGGLLSVGGRLDNALVDEDLNDPFILPQDHYVTELIICYHQVKLGHLGQESVL